MQSFDEQFVEALEEQFSLNVVNLVAWVPRGPLHKVLQNLELLPLHKCQSRVTSLLSNKDVASFNPSECIVASKFCCNLTDSLKRQLYFSCK